MLTAKNIDDNTVFISRNYYTQDKMRDTFRVTDCNWVTDKPTKQELLVKLRHGPSFNKAHLTELSDGRL